MTKRGELQEVRLLFIVTGDAGPLVAIFAFRLEVSLLCAIARITAGFFFLILATFIIAGNAGPFITVFTGMYLQTGCHGIDLHMFICDVLRLIDAIHT